MSFFASDRLRPQERSSAYERALHTWLAPEAEKLEVYVESGHPAGVSASIDPLILGQIMGGIHKSNVGHTVEAAPTSDRGAYVEFYYLLDGNFTIETSTGQTILAPGDMALLPTGTEMRSTSTQMDLMAFVIPDLILPGTGHVRSLGTNVKFSGADAMGACLQSFLQTAANRHADLSQEDGMMLQSVLIDMIEHMAAGHSPSADRDREMSCDRLRALKGALLSQIDDADLTPQALAEQAGISVRTLHRLFSLEGTTFRTWLRDQRLEHCWRDLVYSDTGSRTVAEIAFRWGFNDLTTFNRGFRAKYGVSPRAILTEREPENVPA